MKVVDIKKNIHLVVYQRLQDALRSASMDDIRRYHAEYMHEREIVAQSFSKYLKQIC